MEVKIKDKLFIFKEEISGKEEHDSGILKFLSSLVKQDGKELTTSDMSKLVFSDAFSETGSKLVAFMSLEPKMTLDDVLNLPSSVLFQLKLECLMKYAESFGQLQEMMEKKKLPTLSTSLTPSLSSSEMKQLQVAKTSASQKNSNS